MSPEEEIMMITSEGVMIRMESASISSIGRNTSGVKLMNIDSSANTRVAGVAKVKLTVSEEDSDVSGEDVMTNEEENSPVAEE